MRTFARLSLIGLALLMVAQSAQAASLAPLKVFEDATLDQELLLEATPPFADLTAGYISETDSTLTFTWQVLDLPDQSTAGVPLTNYYYEFTIDDPGANPPEAFSLSASGQTAKYSVTALDQTRSGRVGGGSLESNCVTTGNVIDCTPIPGSVVTVSVDPIANTISATVNRSDLKGDDGSIIAVDGATLVETELFGGIGAVFCPGVCSEGVMDKADMDADYVLGTPRA